MEIVAEIAQGYEGDPTLARLLARGAVRAGADAAKFQLVYADELAVPSDEHYELFRSLEMPLEAWRCAAREVREGGARLYFDVFGERSLREAQELGADGVKIHATDVHNRALVGAALDSMPRVYLSLGGVTVEELQELLALHGVEPAERVCLMYGFQAEPTPLEANNLLRLRALRERFPGFGLGFMDHSAGDTDDAMTLALLALAFEVVTLEKHLTLDPVLALEDHLSALSPARFREFVGRVRRLENALGAADLEPTEAEREYRRKALKVVVARRSLGPGERMEAADLVLKRAPLAPSQSPLHRIEDAAGRTLVTGVNADEPLAAEMLA